MGVKPGRVGFDIALVFQSSNPFQAWAWAQVHASGKVDIADTAVALQGLEDVEVYVVDFASSHTKHLK